MSVRRNVRLRREYLYRKGLEGKDRALYERKVQLKEAIRSKYQHLCSIFTTIDICTIRWQSYSN